MTGRLAIPAPLPLAGLFVTSVGIGVLSGINPKLGLAAALALAFVALVLADLMRGLVIFTVLSFLDVAHFGGAALSFVKVIGLLLAFSWLASFSAPSVRRTGDFFGRHPTATLWLLVFLVWCGASAVWAENPNAAVVAAQRFALDVCLFPIVFTAVQSRKHVTWIFGAFVIGALVSAAYGLVSPSSVGQYDVQRLSGAIGESNELATVLLGAAILAVALMGVVRRSPALQVGAVLGGALALAGLVNTFSRAGLLALAFSFLVAAVIGGRWRRWAILAGSLAVVGAGTYLFVLPSGAGASHVQSTNTSGRSDIWTVGWRMFRDNPINGVGAGNFPTSSVHYLVRPGAITRADYIVDHPKVAHSIYLEFLAGLGVVGLGLFLGIVAFSLSCSFRAARRFERSGDRRSEILARAVIVAIAAFLAADFFASQQFSKQLWLLLALGPALLALAGAGGEPEPEPA
jgi:O-antigen ligase